MAVFHPEVYRTDIPAPSYWRTTAAVRPAPPLEGDHQTEVAVIGGGYAGLSTALHLARDHGIAATVLDAGPIGWGASSRNGGFCSLLSAKVSMRTLARRHGEDETRRFVAEQVEAIDLVRGLLESEGIDAAPQGDATYDVAHHPSVTDGLREEAAEYRRRFGLDTRFLRREEFLEVGHGGTEQFGAVRLAGAFGLNPMKFIAGLREAAERHGARLHGESRVTAWNRVGNRHELVTPGGRVLARTVVVAANGYTPDDLEPGVANRTLPALSNILVTRPLSDAERAAESWKTECPASNARSLLFYYRLLPDRRFLFGARGGTSGSPEENARMRVWLTRRLGEVFPSWRDVEVEYFWNGLVCLTGRLTPAIGRLPGDPSVFYAFGCHGNGVHTGPWSGRVLARAVASGREPDVAAAMRGLPPHLVHPLVRRFGLKAAYLWYGISDRT